MNVPNGATCIYHGQSPNDSIPLWYPPEVSSTSRRTAKAAKHAFGPYRCSVRVVGGSVTPLTLKRYSVLNNAPASSMVSHPARTKTASSRRAAPRSSVSQKFGLATSSLLNNVIQSPLRLRSVKSHCSPTLHPGGGFNPRTSPSYFAIMSGVRSVL